MGDSSVPIPYEPKETPLVEFIEYDKINFKTVTWKVPENVEYKGKIIYVHGFAEHSSIYTEAFDKLSQYGYEIFFFDQRGAGETSPGEYVGKTDEYHTFDDLDFMIKHNLEQRSDQEEKFILAGHSMGGAIVLNYAIKGKYKNSIKKIFAIGPLIKLHPKTEPNIFIRIGAPIINRLFPNMKFDSQLKYNYITSNPKWIEYIAKHDTKLIGTARQFNDMFARGHILTKEDYVAKFDPKISLLVCHGTDDNVNWIKGTSTFINLLGEKINKKFLPIQNGRHSLLIENDVIFNEVFNDVVDFLNE